MGRPRTGAVLRGKQGVDRVVGSLQELHTEVVRARGALHQVRSRTPALQLELTSARLRLVDALRAYEAGLRAGGAPMPYRLRDELRLLESLGRPDVSS